MIIYTDQPQRELLTFKPCSYTNHGNGCYSVLKDGHPYYWRSESILAAIVFDPFQDKVPCFMREGTERVYNLLRTFDTLRRMEGDEVQQ